jgi:hypothetical protein
LLLILFRKEANQIKSIFKGAYLMKYLKLNLMLIIIKVLKKIKILTLLIKKSFQKYLNMNLATYKSLLLKERIIRIIFLIEKVLIRKHLIIKINEL